MQRLTHLGIRGGRPFRTLLAVLLAAPLTAATLTTIEPPPSGEGSTVSIVEDFCPTCERVFDEEDVVFSSANGLWVFAFEDLHNDQSDRDFNDLIVWALFDSGSLVEWDEIASYTAATSSFGFDGTYVFNAASGFPGVNKSWSIPTLNLDGLDHVVSWFRPEPDPPLLPDLSDVPEPASWLMLATGLGFALRFLSRSTARHSMR